MDSPRNVKPTATGFDKARAVVLGVEDAHAAMVVAAAIA